MPEAVAELPAAAPGSPAGRSVTISAISPYRSLTATPGTGSTAGRLERMPERVGELGVGDRIGRGEVDRALAALVVEAVQSAPTTSSRWIHGTYW